MEDGPTLGELTRQIRRLEVQMIRWHDDHEESHKWLTRLMAGTVLSLVTTLIFFVIQLSGRI